MDAAVAQGNNWALEIAMGILETFAALTTNIGYDFEEVLVKNLQFQEKYHLRELGPDRIGIRTFITSLCLAWHVCGTTKATVYLLKLVGFLPISSKDVG